METGSSGQVQRVIQMPAGNASSGIGVVGTGVARGPLASTLDSRPGTCTEMAPRYLALGQPGPLT